MKLRDHLAAQVLAALWANPAVTNAQTIFDPKHSRSVGRLAYAAADRALEQRNKPVEPDPKPLVKP